MLRPKHHHAIQTTEIDFSKDGSRQKSNQGSKRRPPKVDNGLAEQRVMLQLPVRSDQMSVGHISRLEASEMSLTNLTRSDLYE